MEKAMDWWLEQFSGLENDSCPAIDFPDNEQGGSFTCLSVIVENPVDVNVLTAAFAYTLGKFTCQTESLFWTKEEENVCPFYASFDENAPADEFLAAIKAAL